MQMPSFAHNPVPAELFNQQSRITCPTVELALIQELGKQIKIIGANKPDILGFAWIGNVVLCHMSVITSLSLNSGFAPGFPASGLGPCT